MSSKCCHIFSWCTMCFWYNFIRTLCLTISHLNERCIQFIKSLTAIRTIPIHFFKTHAFQPRFSDHVHVLSRSKETFVLTFIHCQDVVLCPSLPNRHLLHHCPGHVACDWQGRHQSHLHLPGGLEEACTCEGIGSLQVKRNFFDS